jgi:fibrillarin-like pre-rRNA processing protein
MKKLNYDSVFELVKGRRNIILTKNLNPGKSVYGEKLIKEGDIEYREWNPKRSKLGAAIMKEVKETGISEGSVVLYLGASYGTTVSHVSDIVGMKGFVFAIDFAPRVLRDLVYLAEDRKNIAPMYFDANHPEEYKGRMATAVDVVFMDIAQREQAEIFLKNTDMFLKKDGIGILAVKARSVDVTKQPAKVFEEVRQKLQRKLKIIDYKILDPYQIDHCIFVCKKVN